MLKRIFYIIIGLFVLSGLVFYVYVWVYDASKPNDIKPQYSIDKLKDELNLLNPIGKEQQFEKTSKIGNKKYIMVTNISKIDKITLKDQFKLEIDNELVDYHEFNTNTKAAIVINRWSYSYIKHSFGLVNLGNPYMDAYGKQAAKGKPNYRYAIKFIVEKGDTRYFARAFCNSPDFLDDIISEFVNQVNDLK